MLVVLFVVAALTFGLAACGGSASETAGSPAAGATTAAADDGGDTGAGHDSSTPAKALVGHWKDGNGSDQYFDGGEWFTVMDGGDSFSYKYDVKEEDVAAKEVLLTTYRLEGDGTTHTDVQDIRFTFLNADFTQLKYGMGGLTADYVDTQERP